MSTYYDTTNLFQTKLHEPTDYSSELTCFKRYSGSEQPAEINTPYSCLNYM